MKHIVKAVEPKSFSEWKKLYPANKYKNLVDPEKRDLKTALICEQKGICCYCERRIAQGDSHIEHFKPKDKYQFPELQLDYTNLHASCVLIPKATTPNICGNKKENCFSTDLISPLEPDCAAHFKFMLNGHIHPVNENDVRAKATISMLGLDDPILIDKRKEVISAFDIDDEEELKVAVELHLNQATPLLGEFYTTIEFLYSAIL